MAILEDGLALPSLSVIIPTYNAAAYIAATLDSIRRQDLPNVEVVIADGGSSDRTVEIAKNFGFERIQILSEPDKGQLDALQKGIAVATGEILVWINGDDIVMPGAFLTVLSVFSSRENVDFVYSDDVAFDEKTRSLYYGATIRGLNDWDHLLFYRQLYSECVYWRNNVTQFLPSDAYDLRVYTDYAFFLNLRWKRRGHWVSQRLGAFRIRSGQASAAFASQKAREFALVKQRHLERIGMSGRSFKLLRLLYWPWFFVRQKARPGLYRGVRRVRRLVTQDRARILETKRFFGEWLMPGPPE